MTAKTYRCTHCGAEIPQKAFLVRRDKVVCPSCGKTLVRWQVIQRQDAAKPLGDPPMGVRVRTGMMAPDRPYEDRIVYSRRKLSGILIGLWMALAFGGAGVMALMGSNLLGIVLLLPGGIGLYWLLFVLFGHDDLHLYAQSGVYTSGIGPWKKRVDFSLSSETYARSDEHLKGGRINPDVTIQEILVAKGECEDARFGSTLPQDVKDFFTASIARRAAGYALASAKGPPWRPEIAHPIAFAVLAVAIVFSVAYSFSGHERIVIHDGVVEIIESEWWGMRIEVTKVPTNDITYIELEMGHGVRGRHALQFLGKDKRVIKRTSGYGPNVSGYQIGLMDSVKCHPGTPFDRTRSTHGSLWLVGAVLLLPLALSCMDVS